MFLFVLALCKRGVLPPPPSPSFLYRVIRLDAAHTASKMSHEIDVYYTSFESTSSCAANILCVLCMRQAKTCTLKNNYSSIQRLFYPAQGILFVYTYIISMYIYKYNNYASKAFQVIHTYVVDIER